MKNTRILVYQNQYWYVDIKKSLPLILIFIFIYYYIFKTHFSLPVYLYTFLFHLCACIYIAITDISILNLSFHSREQASLITTCKSVLVIALSSIFGQQYLSPLINSFPDFVLNSRRQYVHICINFNPFKSLFPEETT